MMFLIHPLIVIFVKTCLSYFFNALNLFNMNHWTAMMVVAKVCLIFFKCFFLLYETGLWIQIWPAVFAGTGSSNRPG